MNSTEKAAEWLHRAKERAYALELLAPAYQPPTTRKQHPKAAPEAGAVESWYEPNPYKNPIQDGNMLVIGKWFRREPVAGEIESRAA